ncbi:unnamed protein product [Brassicogethes aeneus]|uniref:Peptidase aspartic putative domain-containing protein n=1 Tax=Brassicogethes aeneus TaxID=1431903 RepID=A0A9P0FJ02_BRAAE|nr:unnamed protein product [Brassicogethes aeneus]
MVDKPKYRYENLMKKLSSQWSSLQELHEELIVHEDEFTDQYFQDEQFEEIELLYDEYVEKLEERIAESNNESKPNLSLPKIQLPHFKGGYENWATFHDIFTKVIHENKTISRIEKMQYLKAHVRVEASRLIQHLHITDGNYEAAWELLKKRYENTRIIVSKLVDQILDLPKIQGESTKQLQRLHDVTNECLKAIDNLGISTEPWGPLIGRIISRKWDEETNRLYEQSLENPTQVQTLASIMSFLERRFQSLEATKNYTKPMFHKNTHNTSNVNYKTKEKTLSGTMCQQTHAIVRCPKFLSMNVAERNEFVKSQKLCYNCLGHSSEETCYSKWSCRTCNKQHHTYLHTEKQPQKYVNKSFGSKQDSQTKITNYQTTTNKHQEERAVLLATALVRVKAINGSMEYLRVLIDSGSQAALIYNRRSSSTIGISSAENNRRSHWFGRQSKTIQVKNSV